jgi:hypothetical protein
MIEISCQQFVNMAHEFCVPLLMIYPILINCLRQNFGEITKQTDHFI